jgi:NADP-dependent 3-hydroxy acid dehydrogenase YdfG
MKILIAGNAEYGVAKELQEVLSPEHTLTFASRRTGYDLVEPMGRFNFAEISVNYDIVILCSALWKFNQTVLLEETYKKLKATGKSTRIICIGSTIDRVNKSTDWLYSAEKKALRDFCNSLSIIGVWSKGPRVSLISFGSLSNVQEKHPDRKTLPIRDAADYIKWLIDQPAHLHINEISIDPIQIPRT